MFNPNYNPTIYSASKIWHNTKWTNLRDEYGFNITARWINYPCGEENKPTGAKLFTPEEKTVLWDYCDDDVSNADMTVVYAEKDNEMRGALVEMGIAMGAKNPIYVIGTCPSFEVAGHSAVAFMYHRLVHKIREDNGFIPLQKYEDGSYDYLSGYKQAVAHYLEHYHTRERILAKTGFLNARAAASLPRLHKTAIAA